ncbi:MAG: hypothetical protein ACTHLT_16840 [Devosia sp.]
MAAPNAGCLVNGTTANCVDVPTDGINYSGGVDTVNTGNGTPGTTTVTPGTIGLSLTQSGVNSSDTDTRTTYTVITYDIDPSADGTNNKKVLAKDGAPILVGTDYIFSNDAEDSFTIGSDPTTYTETTLAQHLQEIAVDGGSTVAGSLTVTNNGAAFTTGNATGIRVQSLGGNGGNGGCTTILLATWCNGGGSGGNAGSVAVNNNGTIVVTGGYGVSATSIGGTGGKGGGSFGLIVSSPGRGGNGGNGADVTVNLLGNSSIKTTGDGAHGVYAVSNGGNGGSGGSSGGLVALGDKGGNGGNAGVVTVSNAGSIETNGTRAHGIYAESKGAGAGQGSGAGGLVAIGGNGGGESSGNKVTVNNTGGIETKGADSFGILAQSIGGGGGDGGDSGGLFAVGGKAGSGGGSNTVKVNNTGSITTHERGSVGIFAQSVGGGGGNGGNAYSGGLGVSVAVGGDGGLGGKGGKVIVNELSGNLADLASATITTGGTGAHGIQAQSVGGGGGNGGLAISGSIDPTFSASVALGGKGAKGGSADTVTLNEKGHITTTGDVANGIFAQSVGGGGGSGGGAVSGSASGGFSLGLAIGGAGDEAGHGDTVLVNAMGGIDTTGDSSHGILAQSVGGGGGSGGYAVAVTGGALSGSVGLGGNGAGGGNGGAVTVNVSAIPANGSLPADDTIHTRGDGSHAIFAQSVGGGGGSGGFSATGALGGGSISVSIGGKGSGGGTGGAVKVDNSDRLITEGAGSFGLLAQSVGGGGGNGGFSLGASGGVLTAAVAVGGNGGAGSLGGDVTVDNHGHITTLGDLSYGVLAQSLGGGGGNGGSSIALSVAIAIPDVMPAGAFAVAIGGKGGVGSNGGHVILDNYADVETGTKKTVDDEVIRTGNSAHALFAQSVGGGGGNGGFAGAGTLSLGDGASFSLAIGGGGGTGGTGGGVDLTNRGSHVATWGDGADGIHAQSIGGGGGDGGFGLSLAASGGGEGNLSVAVALGGRGGSGGFSDAVTVTNHGGITTDGKKSNGIFAQSVGGGGGTGGFAASGTATISETAGQVGVAVGGGGGDGNYAGAVKVDNYGSITTYGTESLGIFAQSVGGGGGNGGMSVVGQFNFGSENSAQAGVSVGGGGGDGNHAAAVAVSNLVNPDTLLPGTITTYGFGSHGVLAQSVGGGGGKGGMSIYGGMSIGGTQTTANIGVSVGGLGGDGGYGDIVTVINDGAIRVVGDNAMGIVAQSVGGGGGDGGNSIMAMLGITNVVEEEAATFNVGVSVGGFGGDGNYASAVSVTNTGTIITGSTDEAGNVASGLGGNGIFAQSVGGGGGVGGRSNAINVVAGPQCTLPAICQAPANKGNNIALTATVGGNGGTGGDGGTVAVVNHGQIVTFGDTANGIFAQSIGGGGGTGGNGILGTGELSPVPVEMAFIPVGQTAIYKNISVAVGGQGGATGEGNLVDVDNHKNIITLGDYANGIFAQSVGGGGGVGGNAAIGALGKIGVGGEGHAAGNGGIVKVSNLDQAVIETFGAASNGIFAQSIGGGGGIAGNVNRMFAAGLDTPLGHIPVNLGIGLAFGQGGGDGGNGGEVQVDGTGKIFTHGEGSHGIFAQSVGGGGGVQGGLGNELPVLDLLSWHVGSNGDTGSAGKITVDMDGLIATAGNGAHGIFAQSSGGSTKAGLGGTGGNVDISVDGQVVTAAIFAGDETAPLSGYGSVGIMAQSVGWGGNGNVTVTLKDVDTLVSGGRSGDVVVDNSDPLDLKIAHYQGVGVFVVDGNANTVTNHGTITTAGGVDSGWAIYATGSDPTNGDLSKRQAGGNEAVTNHGTVTGSVDLGAGTNSFGNEVGARFNMGGILNIGTGNDFTNNGWMSAGGNVRVMTTKVTADVVQNLGATYGVDLDLARTLTIGDDGTTGEADLLDVAGDLAMAGGVDLTILNAGYATPGTHTVTIARATGTFDPTSVALTAPASLVATYELTTSEKELMLDYSIDFDIDGLNGNQSAIGDYINNVQLGGGADTLAPLVAALFGISELDEYKDLLDQLSPEPYVINETLAMLASLNFENSLMSCKVQDGVNKFDAEGQCAWASLGSRRFERDETASNTGFDQTTFGLSGGAQARLSDNVFLGFGGSWESLSTEGNDSSSSTGQRLQGGAVLKGVWDNTTLALAVTAGMSTQDVTRTVGLPLGPIYTLEGTQDIGFASAHARLAQSFGDDNWYVKPMVDVGVMQVSVGDFSETGGPMALNVVGHDQLYATVAPAVEIGGQTDFGESAVIRTYARLGLLGIPVGSDPAISAGFADAPDGVAPFTVLGNIDRLLYDVTFGLDVIADNGTVVRLSGDAKVGDTVKSYGGSIKVSAPF